MEALYKLCKGFIYFFIFIVSVFLIASWRPKLYSAEPFSGRVIDQVTGLPVSGAVVVVSWISQSPDFHSPRNEIFETQEAVTDNQGRYFILGWTSKILLRFSGSIAETQPEMLVYKYGYKPISIQNSYHKDVNDDAKAAYGSIIRWRGLTEININPRIDSQKGNSDFFDDGSMPLPVSIRTCDWKKRINLILEFDKQQEDVERYWLNIDKSMRPQNVPTRAWYLNESNAIKKLGCPEIIDILANARNLRNKDKINNEH